LFIPKHSNVTLKLYCFRHVYFVCFFVGSFVVHSFFHLSIVNSVTWYALTNMMQASRISRQMSTVQCNHVTFSPVSYVCSHECVSLFQIEEIILNYGMVVISRAGSNPEKFIYESDILSKHMVFYLSDSFDWKCKLQFQLCYILKFMVLLMSGFVVCFICMCLYPR